MNDREKLLTAAVAALVALWGASQGWGKYQDALARNLNRQRSVAQELSTVRTATTRGRRAQQKLRQWQRESLPTDADIAKSLYQDWLQQQLTAAGLKVKDLNIRSPRSSSNRYQQFSFAVNASGKLGQFTDFLYRFYQAQHLHRISQADLTPSSDRKSVTISLTIDSLSLSDGDRKDKLAEGSNDKINRPLEQFRESIVGRNLFTTYQSPESSPEEVAIVEKKTDDTEAAQAKFSSINYGQEGWLMSIVMKGSGKVSYYREGDKIQIGRFEGMIEELDGDRRRAILSTGSGRILIRLGDTLAEAEPFTEQAS